MRRRGGQRPAVNTNRPVAAATYDVRRDLVSALHARCFSRMRLNMKQASIPDSRFRCGAPVALWWTLARECHSPRATATAGEKQTCICGGDGDGAQNRGHLVPWCWRAGKGGASCGAQPSCAGWPLCLPLCWS